MSRAFVLIETLAGGAVETRDRVANVVGVETADVVAGPADVIARVRAETIEDVNDVIDRIQEVPGVARTTTCLVLGSQGSSNPGGQPPGVTAA